MFYTYLWLREDGTPYYVGKGVSTRTHRPGCPPSEQIITQEWESEPDAYEAEKFLISYYGRVDLGTGCLYNLSVGGRGGAGHIGGWNKGASPTEETRLKMSKSHTGYVRSEESKAKQGRSLMGHGFSEVARKKMREAAALREKNKKGLFI